ncbi:cytokine receptor common subunit beta [Larimichthys crocea]|uniref:cytokine receptor common subunit beta n=1 Tax=Larimichthys crocea TaxID=215358 RepID=UPI000F5D5E6F|nr:interleukin-3 receptor class 2 subunit beta [Larimichthys crocea]
MMPLLWVLLWPLFLPVADFSSPDHCTVHDSISQNESSLLQSLQCYNDYESFVHCTWSEHRSTKLQLWFEPTYGKTREQCVRDDAAAQDATENRTVHCRYNTDLFAIGIKHTVFFLKNETESICSVRHEPLDLSQHLRARHPVNLSTHDAGDGGQLLSWSSPYPSSSSLNENITYQLSYRTDRQDSWTMEDVTNTSVKLEKQLLVPGRTYEAQVRARVSVGQWSHWSPAVTWQTKEDVGQFPSLHCVLDGENEVMCSWKVSRELAHFITYQLACQHNQTAPSKRCCENPTVTPDLSGTMLKYSCSLTVADSAHLLLDLVPTRRAKIIKPHQHIRPNPPQEVKVRPKNNNWIVEWTEPNTTSKLVLYYELCYNKIQDHQECTILPVPKGSMSQTILETFLDPSQEYQVKVRSLVAPGTLYKGVPSEWTEPVRWTSHEATWSPSTLIYLSISVLVAAIFFTLYCTIPACQRRVVLWVDSVPSPGKSKILSEFKSATNWTLMQSESTAMCKVQHMDSISTCSSDASLWLTKDSETKCLEKDDGCWKCGNLPSPTEEVHTTETSSMSFSGPYIFCQLSEPNCTSVDVKCEEEKKETPSDESASSSPATFTIYGQGYVCLPSRSASKSTQDLTHCDADTDSHRQDSAEQDQQHPDKSDVQQGLDWTTSGPTSIHQPPAYVTGPFTSWPQGGTIQPSGYCHIPTSTHPT